MDDDKIKAFDYMLHLFFQWRNSHKEVNGKTLPKLTAMKMLFLTSVPKEDGGDDLLDIFNNFYAMPYGPCEIDIQKAMDENKMPSFNIEYRSIEPRKDAEPYEPKRYYGELYNRVRHAVNELREKNENLVLLNAFDLVGLTQRWHAWGRAMEFAEFMEQLCAKMPTSSIRESYKVFDFK